MKLKTNQPKQGAFTLIEMIGVLAVIAILAAVLIPKVFEAINNSRINNASMSCDTVKTAIADHYAKWGGLNVDGSLGSPVTITTLPAQYDTILLKEQFLDKLFVTKIGDGTNAMNHTHVEIVANQAGATVAAAAAGGDTTGYALSGGGTVNECQGSFIVQAVITGVQEADAQALSQRIDGVPLSNASLTGAAGADDDLKGRVKYIGGATTTVYVYLTHR
jgi:prepilin-type N-terminal cleavage/methylation domain-containing protein